MISVYDLRESKLLLEGEISVIASDNMVRIDISTGYRILLNKEDVLKIIKEGIE